MIPHVENDHHALMAIGHLQASLSTPEVEAPSMAVFYELWIQALDSTRNLAKDPDPITVMEQGLSGSRLSIVDNTTRMPMQPQGAEPQGQSAEPQGGRRWAAPDAQSDNLVKLVPCEVAGCDNQIPDTKEMRVCKDHEPKAGDADDVEITDV